MKKVICCCFRCKKSADYLEIQKITDMAQIIEAAYLSGFEPSSDNLIAEELFNEARAYLTDLSTH